MVRKSVGAICTSFEYAPSHLANVDTNRINAYTCRDARLTMAPVQDLYLISMAARLLGLHPQTLRKYERLGLV